MVLEQGHEDVIPKGRVPTPLFEAWIKANLRFPQTGIGNLALVGKTLYEGNWNVSDIAKAELSGSQIDVAIKRMRSAHTAHKVSSALLETNDEEERRIKFVWQFLKARLILYGANYTNLVNDIKPMSRFLQGGTQTLEETYARELDYNLQKKPWLRKELIELFCLYAEAVETKRISKMLREIKRIAVVQKKYPGAFLLELIKSLEVPQGSGWELKRNQVEEKAAREIYDFISRNSIGKNFSINLTKENLQRIFSLGLV